MGGSFKAAELRNQFVVFQIGDAPRNNHIQEMSTVQPTLKGSRGQPDVLVKLQLHSFHTGSDLGIERESQVTMRLDFGKDAAANSKLDQVFWSLTAGLDLYDKIQKKPVAPRELGADFDKAFAGRPIEIPGGLGKLRFEVVKHRKSRWWQRVLSKLQGSTGKRLAVTLGLPAVTADVLGIVNEALNKWLDMEQTEVLFRSYPMTLALTEQARRDFARGCVNVSVGVLNRGFCLLARGRDYETLLAQNPRYSATYGRLVPAGIREKDLLTGEYADPFEDMTYAVFLVAAKESKLNPDLNFGAP